MFNLFSSVKIVTTGKTYCSQRVSIFFGAIFLLFYSLSASAQDQVEILEENHPLVSCASLPIRGYLQTTSLQVLSWNVLKGQRLGWQNKLTQLRAQNTLFMLQEAAYEQPLFSALGERQSWYFTRGYLKGKQQTGVLTSIAVRPVEVCKLQHFEPLLGTPKAALITRYPLEGRDETLLVANVHAINISLGVGAFSLQLNDIAEILKAHTGPIIFAGDFNTWTKLRMRIVQNLTEALALQEVPFNIKQVKTFAGNPLDRIFYRGLVIDSYQVVEVDSSDHNILKAEFSFEPAIALAKRFGVDELNPKTQ